MTTEPSPTCRWCSKPFKPRRGGGHDQQFCRSSCRRAFHAEARSWALAQLATGRLTVAHIRKGLPATRTFPGGGLSPAPVPEEGKAAALLDELLDAFPVEVLAEVPPDDTLGRIIAYLGEPQSEGS